MHPIRRKQIEQRWKEIDAELTAIAEGKVTRGIDPDVREVHLLDEQDVLELALGEDRFENRGF